MTAARPDSGWNRREFARAGALLAAAFGLPAGAFAAPPAADAPTARQRLLLREVCQQVLPRTATAGAGEVGTHDFVLLALAHGLEGSRRPAAAGNAAYTRADKSLDHARWLAAELDRRAHGDWMKAPPARRTATLATLDAEAFAGAPEHPWRTIKALILTGYYTSEVGGAKELNYELVPGRLDPDLPVTAQTRAFSSDWTAVDFG